MKDALTVQQDKFVQLIVFRGYSQRKAYREAYPHTENWKDASVDSKASALFNRDKVQERYNELLENTKKLSENEELINSEEILRYCKKVMYDEMEDTRLHKDPDTGEYGTGYFKPSLSTKARYMDMACKILGAYKENVNLSTDSPVKINIDIPRDAPKK